jgi:hypothetical protein
MSMLWHSLLCLAVLRAAPETGGVSFPEQARGDVTARLEIHVADAEVQPGASLVRLTLTITGGLLLEVESPRLADPVNAWEVMREESRRKYDDRLIWTESIQLRQIKPGLASLPDVKVRFRDDPTAPFQDAEWIDLLKSMREGPAPDMLPPVPSQMKWLSWIGSAGGMLALSAAVWAVLRRWRRASQSLPPHKLALQELTQLQKASIPSLNRADYHTLLADVIRRYIAERYALPATRLTTAEFLATMRASGRASVEQQELLRDFLELCDLAKFAPVGSSPEECREATALARAFVERTATVNGAALAR